MSQLSFALPDSVNCNGAIDGTVASAFPQPLANAAYDSESSSWKMSGSLCQRDAFCLHVFIFASGPLKGYTAYVPMPTSQFRFLDLPVELRTMIYEHLLIEPDPIRLSRRKSSASAGKRKIVGRLWRLDGEDSQEPNIVKVNQQIHREAVEILYGTNVFELPDHKTLKTFIQIIGASSRFLRRVYIPDMEFARARNLMNSLACAPTLQKIELNHLLVCDNTIKPPKASMDDVTDALQRFVRVANRSRDSRGVTGNAHAAISIYHSKNDIELAEAFSAGTISMPLHRCRCKPEEMAKKDVQFGENLRAKLAGA